MKRKTTFIVILIIIVLALLMTLVLKPKSSGEPVEISGITVPPVPTLDPEIVAQGEKLYSQSCAGCHGANLEGVPDWKIRQPDGSLLPPPHDSSGHTWHHPDELLIEIIKNGGDPSLGNTKMPAFGDQLSRTEIMSILDFIKSRWGQDERDFQWWITARGQ